MSPSRDEDETTSTCPVCATGFSPTRRQRYCTPACRQRAFRARRPSAPLALPALPPRRREATVYACTECEQRYLGQQWCHDCHRPCTRVGLGGSCPHCEEPVAVDDLLPAHHDHLNGHQAGENTASTKPGAVQSYWGISPPV